MPKLIYTQAKGVFESGDSLSGVSISDRAVSQEAKPVNAAAISYIRIYNQKTAHGDAYAALEDTIIKISDGNGTVADFEFSVNGDAIEDVSGTAVAVDISAQVGNAPAAGGGVAEILLALINTAFTGGKLFAVKGAATEGDDPADGADTSTNDYVDITIYAQAVGKGISISTTGASTHIEHGVTQRSSVGQSLDGGFYLPAGRGEDDATVDADSSLIIGALSNGTVEGETILVLNNSSNRVMQFSGAFNGGNQASIDHGEGSKICWNGSAWDEVGYVTGSWTLATV